MGPDPPRVRQTIRPQDTVPVIDAALRDLERVIRGYDWPQVERLQINLLGGRFKTLQVEHRPGPPGSATVD